MMDKVPRLMTSVLVALVAVIFLDLALWLPPRLVTLYRQEQGVRFLLRALLAEGSRREGDPWLNPKPLTRPDAQALVTQAMGRYQSAVQADPANFLAYLWLGRAALLLDQPSNAVAAFSAAVRLRPDNPLGWWELGLAYSRLVPSLTLGLSGGLEEGYTFSPDELPQPILIDQTSTPLRHIRAVDVEATSVESSVDTSLPVWSHARWAVADAPGGWPGWWVPAEPVTRPVFFVTVPATVTFQISLPITPTALVFWMGVNSAVQAHHGDEATYRVWVEGVEVFSHTLQLKEGLGGWWPVQADLTPWAGQTIRLTLTLHPGFARAGWSNLQVVEAVQVEGVLADAERRAFAAWREGRISVQRLIEAGEAERKAQRYEEALEWYRRAMRLEPHRGDPWYYVGLAFEGMGQWEEALAAYERAVAIGSFAGVHRSSPYYRIGLIYQRRLEPRQLDAALAAYEAAIKANDFSNRWEAANCHFDRGVTLVSKGAHPSEYIPEFQKAIELNPWHEWAYVRLGVAYYAWDRDAIAAEAELRQALTLSPRNKWAYYHLGEIYRQEGRMNDARAMYEKALEIDPEFGVARRQLEKLPDQH